MRRTALPLLLTLSLLAPASALGQEPATLSVVGNGTARLTPDVAVVAVGFSRRAKKAVEARNSVNRRSKRLIGAAKGLGIASKEITTSAITLERRTLKPLHKGGNQRIRYT